MTPHQIESTPNVALGELLQPMLPGCVVHAEQTQTVAGHPGRHPDVLITAAGRAPVVIEAEYDPGANPEADARPRLGVGIAGEIRPVEAAVALRYPEGIGTADNLAAALAAARFRYCVLYENGSRFPESGWLVGGVADLADLIRLVSVPQKAVDDAADALQQGIDSSANVLNQMPESRPDISPAIARRLNINDVPQMRRMACAIIANAMLFHERLAGRHGIKPLQQICNPDTPNPQAEILAAWRGILDINYLDIFEIARDIVAELPTREAAQILNIISFQVLNIAARGINNDHDLTGQVFQRLIADRKYLATFYTLPPSAALLARLAVGKMDGVDWSDNAAIGQLRIADFACGTGALLSAVYEQIAARHARAGGDAAALHPVMMEQVIYGCDVMPSAVHITGATLAGLQPTVSFAHSNLQTMEYGRQADGKVRIGSLEMLDAQSGLNAAMPDGHFDLVIMNPPFTSNTKHRDAGGNVQNAAFAAFGARIPDQDDMAARLIGLARDSCYHGHAGLGSAFAAIANQKVRPGGVIALLILFTAANGSSWAKFRQLMAEQYTDITIVSIAANGADLSFSSDTGVAECMVIARKLAIGEQPDGRAQFISLRRRPPGFAAAREIVNAILGNAAVRHLEDGPYGGIPIFCGGSHFGEFLDASIEDYQNGWGASRIADAAVAQAASALSKGKLWLPAEPDGLDLPMATLGRFGQRGVDHQLLVSAAHRGPFIKEPPTPTATYPSLYNHDAKSERFMVCRPDAALRVKPGMEARAAELWATASRAHLTLDFRFTSQPLAAAITEYPSIGGTAWPNVAFPDARFDCPFAVWCNSTLGLLSFWWHSSRQQDGRGRTTLVAVASLPTLDLRALTDAQLATAQAVFDEFRDLELQPAYLADADANRALLDRRVICDLLGFDAGVYQAVRRLAAKWCAEPSVHGGKARPQGAGLVI